MAQPSPAQTAAKQSPDFEVQVETEKFVFFWKPPTVFGQWTPSEFVVDGVQYDCAEMYMMAEKAKLFGDEEMRQQILDTRGNPRKVKALGQRVDNFDQSLWDQHSLDIVVAGNMAKFQQNSAMLEELMGTGSKILVEASPMDRIWGIGLRADHPDCRAPSRWRGSNKLGIALMKVREQLGGGVAPQVSSWRR